MYRTAPFWITVAVVVVCVLLLLEAMGETNLF